MSHSRLLKITFWYGDEPSKILLIPVRFIEAGNKLTPSFNAILDFGADEITIPKKLADLHRYKLTPRFERVNTISGKIGSFETIGNFNIGHGGREVEYKNIEIYVIDHNVPVLIRKPIC